MLHTSEAVQVFERTANFTGLNLDNYAQECKWSGVGVFPITKNRDSDAMERSNFDTAIDEISAKYGENSVRTLNFGHWACGWVLIAVYDTGIEGISEGIADINKRLKEYALLDDGLWSQYQWDDNHPEYAQACYSEDEDCPCGKVKP